MDTCRSSVAIHVILQTSWHFTFWHPFAYLSCSSLLLFPFAATPLFLGYVTVIVCCVYVCVCYCMFCMLCGFRDMLRIQMEACTLFVCFVVWGWRFFYFQRQGNHLSNKKQQFREISQVSGLRAEQKDGKLKFYVWPSFPHVACFRNFTQCVG